MTAYAAINNDLALHLSIIIIFPFITLVEEIEDDYNEIITAINIDSEVLVPLVLFRLSCLHLNLLQGCAERLPGPRTPSSSIGNEKIQVANHPFISVPQVL